MTTYSISLDEVVAPSPAPAHSRRHSYFLKEHFEFQVMKKDAVEEPIFYTCHICDIQVPTAFASEHGASIKHRANANIASVAASRLRASAVALPPAEPPSTSHPMAFCANCSTIIVDEKHHETREHTVAVMNDKLLWNLMNAYVKRDIDGSKGLSDMDNRNAKTDNDQITKDDPNARDVDSNDKKGENLDGNGEVVAENLATYIFIDSTLKQYFNSSSKVVDNLNEPTVVPASSRGFRSLTKAKEMFKEESSITKQNYAKQLSEKHAKNSYIELLCKVNNMDCSQSGLKELHGEILIHKWNEIIHVPADNFHSIIYDKHGNAVCVLCKAKFNADDAETHKYEIIHMNQVVNVCDSYGIRKVQFGTRHCIICNLKLKKKAAIAHVKSREHVEKKNLYTKTKTDMNIKSVACNQNKNGSKDNIENAAIKSRLSF